jgi:hypothetical protein
VTACRRGGRSATRARISWRSAKTAGTAGGVGEELLAVAGGEQVDVGDEPALEFDGVPDRGAIREDHGGGDGAVRFGPAVAPAADGVVVSRTRPRGSMRVWQEAQRASLVWSARRSRAGGGAGDIGGEGGDIGPGGAGRHAEDFVENPDAAEDGLGVDAIGGGEHGGGHAEETAVAAPGGSGRRVIARGWSGLAAGENRSFGAANWGVVKVKEGIDEGGQGELRERISVKNHSTSWRASARSASGKLKEGSGMRGEFAGIEPLAGEAADEGRIGLGGEQAFGFGAESGGVSRRPRAGGGEEGGIGRVARGGGGRRGGRRDRRRSRAPGCMSR